MPVSNFTELYIKICNLIFKRKRERRQIRQSKGVDEIRMRGGGGCEWVRILRTDGSTASDLLTIQV